ncbi:MAG TPA: oligosaccharide flippase family protein [Vicinamibacterales bacterium]|nr:oligosaccharide flippase family protein [Vicinamibacterales bacterium]
MSSEWPAESPDIAGHAKQAVAWTAGLQFFRDVVQFGLTLALVRMLPVEAYGQFGLLTTLLTFFTYYSFREFLGYTLQARGNEDVHYQDHFTAGTVIQLVIVVAVNLAALTFRWMPAYAPVATVLHVMSLLFVIDLPAEFRTRMLEREMQWPRLRVLQGVGFVAGGVLSLAMALAGLGTWALIVPTLIVPLPFVYDLFVTARWRPTWAFSWDRFRPAWRFGLTRLLTLTFVAIAAVMESMTLASVLGFALLGIFGRAIGLAQLLCGRLATLLAIAIFPVLTRVPRASDAFRRAGGLYLRVVAWTVIPAAVLAALLADPIVRALYGSRWVNAIPLVPWALAAAAFAAIAQTAYTVLLASGQQRACAIADAWKMVGILGALALALPAGPTRYLAAVSAVQFVALLVVSRLLWKSEGMAKPALFEALAPAVVSAATAGAALWATGVLSPQQVPTLGAAALAVPLFATVYVAVLRLLFGGALREVVGHLPRARALSRVLLLA